MDKALDELHNHEDASSFSASVLLFLGIFLVLGILGVIFWLG